MVSNGDVREAVRSRDVVRVIDTASEGFSLPIVHGDGTARAVLWPGNGARFRSLNLVDLGSGSATIDMTHANDCVYYVIAGAGQIVDLKSGAIQPLIEGAMVHIDAGDAYRLVSEDEGVRLVGGPCPPDAALYALPRGQVAAESEV
jgi:mannose-6-phosphate isomerase-like protein (cupin superfamily)